MSRLERQFLRLRARTSRPAAGASRAAQSSVGRAVGEGGWLLARGVSFGAALLWGLSRL